MKWELAKAVGPASPRSGIIERLLHEFAHQSEGKGGVAGKQRDEAGEVQVKLTDRQVEVLRLVSSGLTYKEVGTKLALSEVTIRYHMSEIMRLLHLENRSQMLAYAGMQGLNGLKHGP